MKREVKKHKFKEINTCTQNTKVKQIDRRDPALNHFAEREQRKTRQTPGYKKKKVWKSSYLIPRSEKFNLTTNRFRQDGNAIQSYATRRRSNPSRIAWGIRKYVKIHRRNQAHWAGRDILGGAGASRVSSYEGSAWGRAWLSAETILAP